MSVSDFYNGYMARALTDLAQTLEFKNADYSIDTEFSNFEFAAELVNGSSIAPVGVEDVILTQIGIKLGRLQGLPADPRNESVKDTYKDLAGYAVILYAYALKKAADEGSTDRQD